MIVLYYYGRTDVEQLLILTYLLFIFSDILKLNILLVLIVN